MDNNRQLKIKDVETSHDGNIVFTVVTDGSVEDHWFRVPPGVRPHGDLVACAIAAVFANGVDHVEYLAPISPETRVALESATHASWDAALSSSAPRQGGTGAILSFSGGLDSLAAYALLGNQANLVAVDFGEKFSRERNFFESFGPSIVETSVRGSERTWTFMGVGAILMREELDAGFLSFGSILEATPWNFMGRPAKNSDHAIFRAAGFRGLSPISGLTEFGTTLVASRAFPAMMSRALMSLADTHTEKWFRKHALLAYMSKLDDVDFELSEPPESRLDPVTFGKSFTVDFLSPGMAKFLDAEKFEEWMSAPAGLRSYAEKRRLEYYFADNGDHRDVGDSLWAQRVAMNKAKLGIRPYDEVDWREFSDWEKVLRVFHKFPFDRE